MPQSIVMVMFKPFSENMYMAEQEVMHICNGKAEGNND